MRSRSGNGGYVYLMGTDGELIYHPESQLLYSGLEEENLKAAAATATGSTRRCSREKAGGDCQDGRIHRMEDHRGGADGRSHPECVEDRILIVFIVVPLSYSSSRSSMLTSLRGLRRRSKNWRRSVNEIEAGNLETEVYVGGSYEIRHLGTSIQNMATQIRQLMDDIVAEHESKRKE